MQSVDNVRNYVCVRDFTLAVETMQEVTANDPNQQYSAIYETDDGQLWKLEVIYKPRYGVVQNYRYRATLRVTQPEPECHAELTYFERFGEEFKRLKDVEKCSVVKFTHDSIHSSTKGFGSRPDALQIGVRVRILVKRLPVHNDFSPASISADVALVAGGVKFHVNKGYLSVVSPYFATMFGSDFRERHEAEIVLNDIEDPEHLQAFLNAVYPHRVAPTAENVVVLTELAHQYQVDFLLDECVSYLKKCENVPIIDKLVLAEGLDLCDLSKYVLAKITMDQIETVQSHVRFYQLSKELTDELFSTYIRLRNGLYPQRHASV
ncbi:BTB/POZ domain-containing protein [Aphelenchoides avenae]|nr:BTB/POZ domain-containing protein [Aphelenchus avenae]